MNSGEFVEVRHLFGAGPLGLFSNGTLLMRFCWFLCLLGILLFLERGSGSFFPWKLICQVALSDNWVEIVQHVNIFVGRIFVITKFGRLLDIFLLLRLFVNHDRGFFLLVIGCDHSRRCGFVKRSLWRSSHCAGLTELTHFSRSDNGMIIVDAELLVTISILGILGFFEVLARFVGKSQGFLIIGLHFGGVVT